MNSFASTKIPIGHTRFHLFLCRDYKIDVVYYATKQLLAAISRVFIIQGIDVWKWYNELPLTQLKHLCNPGISSIFCRFNVEEFSDAGENGLICDYKQNALKLQALIKIDHETKIGKSQCCRNHNCLTPSCEAFLDRFNFEHLHGKELANLKMQFKIEF